MFEFDFLPVGNSGASGDAIALRFRVPDRSRYAHVIVDAGFSDSGDALVEHVRRHYGTSHIDIAVLTHPDGDHIGGMGTVLRELTVDTLWLHRLDQRGGAGLPAAKAVAELVQVAAEQGTSVLEPFSGVTALDGCVTVLGPDEDWYGELVAEQKTWKASAPPSRLMAAARRVGQTFLSYMPVEVPFDDAGGANPRNNSSVVLQVQVDDHRAIFTGDAGVPALHNAWIWRLVNSDNFGPPNFIQLAHHGSRHNASSDLLSLVLGEPGQSECRTAFISVAKDDSDHPSPRVVNAYKRRGCRVFQTAGAGLLHHSADAPDRGWGPAVPLEVMDETAED